MNKETLDYLSDKIGVKLTIRDKEEWMNESMDVRAKYLAKITQPKCIKSNNLTDEQIAESMNEFYKDARRKD
tara:strand:- start:281 stop:496 length:216 start_codon:yes stop_codon:yes gene_type:complete